MKINTHGGGANTNVNGLKFEQDTSLDSALTNNGYCIIDNKVLLEGSLVGYSLQKHNLYKFFEHIKDEKWRQYISKKILPDDAFYNISNNTVYIIEKKFQHGSGSVDEKLQTCDFKKKEYIKLLSPAGVNVEYLYVLNDWFEQPMYDDVKEYISVNGCYFFFNSVPITFLGL